jgi:hypothetical protein
MGVRRGSVVRGVLAWSGVLLWVLAPVAGLVLLGGLEGRASFVVPERVAVPVRPHDQAVGRTADLGLQWSDGVEVPAPGWTGVVQQVAFAAGEEVASGTTLATVDGVDRFAWATPGAFFRELRRGDRGPDAVWLNDLLAERGHAHTAGDRVTARTVRGIDALGRSLGAAAPEGVFDPTWVVFLPRSPLEVVEVGLVVGHPAPAAGEAVLTSADVLERAVLAPRGTYAGSEATGVAMVASLTAADGERLVVAGSDFPLDATRSEVSAEALSDLGTKLATGAAGVSVQLVREPGVEELVVPSAALFSGASGGQCVRVAGAGATEDQGPVVAVQVVGSQDGNTVITGALDPAVRVLVPGVEGPTPCP